MANLINHLYGEVTRVENRNGWNKRESKILKHLKATCPRCEAERARAEEHRASVENS